jgi:hypothetical protein
MVVRMRIQLSLLFVPIVGVFLGSCKMPEVVESMPGIVTHNDQASSPALETSSDMSESPDEPESSKAKPNNVGFAWVIMPDAPRDTEDGGILFFGEGGPVEDREAAVEAATASALAEASRTRDSRIQSIFESRSRETQTDSQFSFEESIRLDSAARFSGARTAEREVHGVPGKFHARVRLRVDRDQVFIGDVLKSIWSEPKGRHIKLLHGFVNAARSRGDSDAQALGLQQVLLVSPTLSDVLELVDLMEDKGFTSAAYKLARRWNGRVADHTGRLKEREAQLEKDLISPREVVAQLLVSLEGARRIHTNLVTSSKFLERHGPRASMRLYGEVRAQQPLSFLWIDGSSISAPRNLAIPASQVEEHFEWELVNWDGVAEGYTPGRVRLVVLSGNRRDPAPILEPDVLLPTAGGPSSWHYGNDNDRLKTFVAKLQTWIQGEGNEVQVLDWNQR